MSALITTAINDCSTTSGSLLLEIPYFSHGTVAPAGTIQVGQIKMPKGVGREKAKGSLN